MIILAIAFRLLNSGKFIAETDINRMMPVLTKIVILNLFGINLLDTIILNIKTTRYAMMVAYAAPTIPNFGIRYILKQILIILPMHNIYMGYFVFSFNWKK